MSVSKNTTREDFAFRGGFAERAKKELAKYPASRKQSAVLALLDLAQRQNKLTNCVTDNAMSSIASMLGMSVLRLEEVASFYTMINRKSVGKYHVQCCMTTPCMLCGSDDLLPFIENHLGIVCGESTSDGLFTLSRVECLGACANAPVVQINDDFHEDVTPERMGEILRKLKPSKKNVAKVSPATRGAKL